MKNKFLVFSILIIFLHFSAYTGFAQETPLDSDANNSFKVRPVRIGVKAGFPNIIGGNIEYVTPFLGKRLALYTMLMQRVQKFLMIKELPSPQ